MGNRVKESDRKMEGERDKLPKQQRGGGTLLHPTFLGFTII